jgi:hypothetical protein
MEATVPLLGPATAKDRGGGHDALLPARGNDRLAMTLGLHAATVGAAMTESLGDGYVLRHASEGLRAAALAGARGTATGCLRHRGISVPVTDANGPRDSHGRRGHQTIRRAR